MSAVVPAALFAIAAVIWRVLGLPSLIVPAVGAAAVTTVLSHRPAARPRTGRFAFVAACGFAIGAAASPGPQAIEHTPLPVLEADLTSLSGTVVFVSQAGAERQVTVNLATASTEWVCAAARGAVWAIVGAGPEIEPGSSIEIRPVPGALWRDDSGRLWVRAAGYSGGGAAGYTVAAAAAVGRARLRETIDVVSGRASPLLAALLLGDGSDVDPRVDSLFRRSGVIHLLALSGMHLAVIALLVRGALTRFVGPLPAAVAACVAAALYLLLVGPRPGLVRACLLVTIGTTLALVDRRRPLVELLCLSLLLQLVVQPGAATTVGFQLSYLSLVGIALFAAPVAEALRPWLPVQIGGPLSAGGAAQLATVPLLLARFGRWYPVGIVATLVMGPMVLLFMSAGLGAVMLASAGVPHVARVSVPVLELLYRLSKAVGWFFAGTPVVAPRVTAVPVAVTAVVAVTAGVAALARIYRQTDGGDHREELAHAP